MIPIANRIFYSPILRLEQGEKAIELNETPVGCVLVYDNQIVGVGMNDTNRSMNVGDILSIVRSTLLITM
jgi:tRNA-specific adenosine deaminase 2